MDSLGVGPGREPQPGWPTQTQAGTSRAIGLPTVAISAQQMSPHQMSTHSSPASSFGQSNFELGTRFAFGEPHNMLDASTRDVSNTQKLMPGTTAEEHLAYARGSNLPTVNEDDIFSPVEDVELGLEQEMEMAEALEGQGNEPSRTLLVKNLAPDASDDELRSIFQMFGDVRALYTGAKHRGVLLVCYYDLRAAVSAVSTLQGTLVCNQPINISFAAAKPTISHDSNIHQGMVVIFNLDPDTTNEHLVWLFSKFGEVKDIQQSPARPNQKFITFYDTRHAAAALKAMNRAENLNKLPAHLTPQQVATLQSHTSGPNLMQLAQLHQLQASASADSTSTCGAGSLQWDLSTSPVAMEGFMNLVKPQQHPRSLSSGALLGSVSGCGTSQPNLQASPSSGAGPSGSLGGGPQMHHPTYGKFHSMDPLNAGAKTLHISDSASSIASVPAGLMMGAGGVAVPKNLPGMQHMAHGMARQPSGSAPGRMTMPGMGDGGPHMSASAAANSQAAAQQQLLWDASEAANMLMNLGLGGGDQRQWSDSHAGGPMGAGAGGAFGGGGMGWANPNLLFQGGQLNALQELQARQQAAAQLQQAQQQVQHQAQQLVLAQLQAQQAFQAHGLNLGSPANLQAAAQILQAAGLNHPLGQQAGFLPGALNTPSTSAAAQLLQQSGLQGLQGMGMGGLTGVNPAALQAQLGMVNAAAARGGMMAGRHGLGDPANSRSGGRLSRRTTDPAAEAERKAQQEKLYALDLEKIARGEDRRTTLMIKNIPNKYTQKMLLATVDEHFKGTYDFFYLPIDFKNKCNVGYAFINMVLPVHIIPLVQRFNQKKWERFNSEKVCNISYARIQGRSALVQHFQNSSLMHEDKRCRPILFTLGDSGDMAGEQEPFPSAGNSGMGSRSNSAAHLSGLAASSNSLRSMGGSSNSLRELGSAGGTPSTALASALNRSIGAR